MKLDDQPLIKIWVIKHPRIAQFWIATTGKKNKETKARGFWTREISEATIYHSIPRGSDVIKRSPYLENMGAWLMPVILMPFDRTKRMMKARSTRIPLIPNRGSPPLKKREPMTIISFRLKKNLVNMWKSYCTRRGFTPKKALRKMIQLQLRYEGKEISPEKIML